MKQVTNIAAVIAELQDKRDELDKAIIDLMKLQASGLFDGSAAPRNLTAGASVRPAGGSAFKLAIKALEEAKKPLVMRELVEAVRGLGWSSKSKTPSAIISTTLYKAMASKKNCKLVKMKDGLIGLRGWK